MAVLGNALESGLIYALAALGLYLSYRVLHIADMTTDASFTLGCAVSAVLTRAGLLPLALPGAVMAGAGAGLVTAMLQTRLKIPPILAGIITGTGLYTVNLAVMGFSANVNVLRSPTVFALARSGLGHAGEMLLAAAVALLAAAGLALFLSTRLGLAVRATGDNPHMVRACSVDPRRTITLGLCGANALTALSGGMLAQYQRTADINIGTGLVITGLASLILGEALLRREGTVAGCLGAVLGSILYRLVVALALSLRLPGECLKLASAVIVAAAISSRGKGAAYAGAD